MISALIKVAIVLITLCLEFGWFPGMAKNITNAWDAKELLSMAFSVSIIALFLHRRKGIYFYNPWILLSLVYLAVHPFITPQLEFDNVWDTQIFAAQMYQGTAQLFVYFLLAAVVSSAAFSRHDVDDFIGIFYWLALLISLYCFAQAAGLDQWQGLTTQKNTMATDGRDITGTLAHPNQCGIFLAACLPFVIYRRGVIPILIVCIAIAMTESIMAYAGMAAVLTIYGYYKGNSMARLGITILVSVSTLFGVLYAIDNPSVFSGRLETWVTSWNLLVDGGRFLTGYGFGSFKNIVAGMYGLPFLHMHNDPFQYLFDAGVIGLGLLIFSLIWLTKEKGNHIIKDERRAIFAISFIALLICSLGSFVYQVEPHRFIAVFLFGYLHHKGE